MADISPDLFMDAVVAYQQTAAIKAAVELDLFTEIAKGNATAESLARTTGAAVRGVRILCDYLTVRGHLEKQGDQYRLTARMPKLLKPRRAQRKRRWRCGFSSPARRCSRFMRAISRCRIANTSFSPGCRNI